MTAGRLKANPPLLPHAMSSAAKPPLVRREISNAVIDQRPRQFAAEELETLRDFAKIVEDSIQAKEIASYTLGLLRLTTEHEAELVKVRKLSVVSVRSRLT